MNRSAVLKGFFFVDNIASRTNVHRDDFSTAEGIMRAAQVCAQTRDWFWSWMVEGRKEHTASYIWASYLFILLVIPIYLDVWETHITVSLAAFQWWFAVSTGIQFVALCSWKICYFAVVSILKDAVRICGCPPVHVLQSGLCVPQCPAELEMCYAHYGKPGEHNLSWNLLQVHLEVLPNACNTFRCSRD